MAIDPETITNPSLIESEDDIVYSMTFQAEDVDAFVAAAAGIEGVTIESEAPHEPMLIRCLKDGHGPTGASSKLKAIFAAEAEE